MVRAVRAMNSRHNVTEHVVREVDLSMLYGSIRVSLSIDEFVQRWRF
jgi:hypothetical protein